MPRSVAITLDSRTARGVRDGLRLNVGVESDAHPSVRRSGDRAGTARDPVTRSEDTVLLRRGLSEKSLRVPKATSWSTCPSSAIGLHARRPSRRSARRASRGSGACGRPRPRSSAPPRRAYFMRSTCTKRSELLTPGRIVPREGPVYVLRCRDGSLYTGATRRSGATLERASPTQGREIYARPAAGRAASHGGIRRRSTSREVARSAFQTALRRSAKLATLRGGEAYGCRIYRRRTRAIRRSARRPCTSHASPRGSPRTPRTKS